MRVVTRTTTRIDPYSSSSKAPTLRPIVAKMRPTSPRGSMPKPITHLSLVVPIAPRADSNLPMIARTDSKSAIASTRPSNIAVTSVLMPM